MALTLTTAPAGEPVSLDEAKAFLRLDTSNEDALIASLITTSRQQIEAALGLALITQAYRFTVMANAGNVCLPVHPVVSVDQLVSLDAQGNDTVWSSEDFGANLTQRPATVVLRRASNADDLTGIDFTAGFGDAAGDVPAPIRHAILMLVAHWFEHREPVLIGSQATRIPAGVSELLAPFAPVRL